VRTQASAASRSSGGCKLAERLAEEARERDPDDVRAGEHGARLGPVVGDRAGKHVQVAGHGLPDERRRYGCELADRILPSTIGMFKDLLVEAFCSPA